LNRPQSLIDASVVTRVLVAGVLLTAAAMKGAVSVLVVAEILLAIGLLSGWQWRVARLVAIVWMIGLCGVSLHKALSGAATCGCFGKVQVNPWLTFALDLAMLGALVLSVPTSRLRRSALIGSQLAMLGVLAVMLLHRPPIKLSMKPEDWAHQDPWSLGPYVDGWDEISHGKWVVLLYDPDCRACNALMDSYEQLAINWRSQKRPQRVALIDTVGHDTSPGGPSDALHGIMHSPNNWYIATPTLVILIDGRVVEVDYGFDDCIWNDRDFPDH